MQYLSVLIEHTSLRLNRPFTYEYDGKTPIFPGCRVMVPFNHQLLMGFIIQIENKKPNVPYHLEPIDSIVDQEPLLTEELLALAKSYSEENFLSLMAFLQAMLPPSLKPKKQSLKAPKIKIEKWIIVSDTIPIGLNPKQEDFYRLLQEQKEVPLRSIKQKALLSSLMALGAVTIIEREKFRFQIEQQSINKSIVLTPKQEETVSSILATKQSITLLQGVTGSGKTEIYMALAKQALKNQRGTLIIVPEIALTPMMVEYFYGYFSHQVAVLHSELTPAERYDEYRKIRQGKAKVVIGARSAIFAPLQHIAYIIIDEEHSETYKQDQPPYYDAHDIAFKRAEFHQAKVILGSATPSLETKARAMKKVYHYVSLPQRIHQTEPPETLIVNMSQPSQVSSESFLFSKVLVQAMKDAIEKKEQIILLLNKRGYAPSLVCRQCGYVFRCPECKIPLNVHAHSQNLKCHYCDYIEPNPHQCPECQGTFFNRLGFGTQRVEEEVIKIFPNEKILRLDADTTQIRQSTSKILSQFKNQEASILIGTQMVAKGHDFANVTVVGIVLADAGLSIPSYRSNERTYQLITQAIGRTGRGEKKGKAFLQTYNPHHDIIRLAKLQDYESFFAYEMQQRKLSLYPPYRFLVSLECSSPNLELLQTTSLVLKEKLTKELIHGEEVIGPITPYIEKKGPFYQRKILIKYKDKIPVQQTLKEMTVLMTTKNNFRFTINFNPFDI